MFKIFEETGEIQPNHREYSGFIVDERVISTILAIVFESPDSYLREIAQLVQQHTNVIIAPSTICHIQRIAAQRNAIH